MMVKIGNQLSRQWELLRILESFRYGVNVEELAKIIECSRRTVERDLASLSQIGFPISCESRDFGKKFWRLEKRFLESDKLILAPTEMISMHLARQCLNSLAGTCFGEGIEQLYKFRKIPQSINFSPPSKSVTARRVSAKNLRKMKGACA